jgi:uncharacterized membrane protein
MNPTRSKICKAALIFLSILLLSACIELFFFNYHAIRYRDNSKVVLESGQLLAGSKGFKQSGTSLVSTTENASVFFIIPNSYYSKLVIEYVSTGDSTYTINYSGTDTNGQAMTRSTQDSYDHRLSKAITNVNENISGINIVFASNDIKIQSISLTNEIQFNVLRYVFMVISGILIAFVFLSKKIMAERIEIAFLITALMLGSFMIILMPLKNPVTWDDDTHFAKIYEQSYTGEIEWTQGAYNYEHRMVPQANTIEEKAAVTQLLNNEDNNGDIISKSDKSLYIPYNYLSYLPQSITMFLARSLHMNFTSVLTASRMGGLLFYSLIVCAAISIAKFGKRIISVAALMPTPLFMASNFSYDPFLIALMFLAFAVFTVEYFDWEHKLKLKNTAIFLAAIILGSCTKAVYIPLILIALLFPSQKFESKKSMYLFRAGILAVFFTILSTFVLPAILNPSLSGDLRGGDTSISGQLHFILQDPVFYAKLLFGSIWNSLGAYFCGTGTYTNFAYLGQQSLSICTYLTVIVLLFAAFTDVRKNDRFAFSRSSKIFILALVFSVICLIWTALYLAFTPVGSSSIAGVQSRYYLPLVVPLLFLLRNTKIETSISEINLNRFVFSSNLFILFFTIYQLVLKPYNF